MSRYCLDTSAYSQFKRAGATVLTYDGHFSPSSASALSSSSRRRRKPALLTAP